MAHFAEAGPSSNPFQPSGHRRANSRASLAFVPSAAPAAAEPPRKRSHSLGGDASAPALSPRKRAKLALPVRSILRKSLSASTIQFTTVPDEDYTAANATTVRLEDIETALADEEMTMDLDESTAAHGGRKSLGRRVSFAATAQMRLFDKADENEGTSEASSTPPHPTVAPPTMPSPTDRRRSSIGTAGDASMDLVGDDSDGATGLIMADGSTGHSAQLSFAFPAPRATAGAAALSLLDEPEPDDEMDMTAGESMDLAGDEVTTAFAENTAIMARQFAAAEAQRPASPSSSSDDAAIAASLIITPTASPQTAPAVVRPPAPVEDDDVTMEMSMQLGENTAAAGLGLDDGMTRRRLSTSGAMRRASVAPRGSLAPGHKALALLDAPDEDTDETTTFKPSSDSVPEAVTEPEPAPAPSRTEAIRKSIGNLFGRHRDSIAPRQTSEPPQPPAQPRVSVAPGSVSADPERADRNRARFSPETSLVAPPQQSFAVRPDSPDKQAPSRLPVRVTPSVSSTPFKAPSSLAKATPAAEERRRVGSPIPGREPSPTRPRAASPLKSVVRQATPPTPPLDMDEDKPEDEQVADGRALLLDDFLSQTGTAFMDDMFPRKRKSMAPAGMGEATGPQGPPTLADQVVAAGSLVPQLEMYQFMTRDLRALMTEREDEILSVEEDIANGEIPVSFARWQQASEDERAAIATQLKMTKAYYRLDVRLEYYKYRCELFDKLSEDIDGHLARLDEDRQLVSAANEQLAGVLPDLRSRANELRVELEREKARQGELDEVDPDHLASLREGMVEQEAQLEDYRRQQTDADAQLARLQTRLQELESQRTEATTAITRSQRYCDEVRSYTRLEIERLRAAFELLVDMSDWQLVEFNASEVRLRYRRELEVTLAIVPGPRVVRCEMVLLPRPAAVDDATSCVPAVRKFLFERLKASIEGGCGGVDVSVLLRRVATEWAGAHRLMGEFACLELRHACSATLNVKRSQGPDPFLRVAARVFVRSLPAAFDAVFELTGNELVGSGPDSIVQTVVLGAIEPRVGEIDGAAISRAMLDRIAAGGRMALLEACTHAERLYA